MLPKNYSFAATDHKEQRNKKHKLLFLKINVADGLRK